MIKRLIATAPGLKDWCNSGLFAMVLFRAVGESPALLGYADKDGYKVFEWSNRAIRLRRSLPKWLEEEESIGFYAYGWNLERGNQSVLFEQSIMMCLLEAEHDNNQSVVSVQKRGTWRCTIQLQQFEETISVDGPCLARVIRRALIKLARLRL